MNEKVEANVEAEAQAEVEIEVVSLLYQSLLRVCGGGIASRREMKIDTSSTPCHEQVESAPAPVPSTATTTVSSIPVSQWRKNLEDLAMKSIHFPNGNCSGSNDGNGNGNGNDSKSGSKSGNGTGSNNNHSDDNFGKGHDIEIKIALSLFHRYRSHGTGNRNCNHSSNRIKDDADMNRKGNGNGKKSGERKEMSKKQKNKLKKLEKKRRRLRGGNGNSINIDSNNNNNSNSNDDNNEVPTTSIANATTITQNHVDNNTIKKKKIKINETIVKKCDDNNNNMIVKSSTPTATATSTATSTSKRCDTATLNIISDLGLVRNISSPNELAILLVKDMEDQLWEQRTSTITAVTSMSTSTSRAPSSVSSTAEIHNNDHNDNACNSAISGSSQNMNKCIISQKQKQNQIMMIQSNQSGIICIVTKKRFAYLRNHDRYPCSHCIKWCKGQKGLWWHEQIVHGLDHSSATVVAAASSSLLDCTALVLYNERTSKNNINSSSSKSVGQMIDEGGEIRNKEKKKKEGNDPFFDSIKNGNLNEFIEQQQQQPQQSQPQQLQCKTYDPKSHLDKNGASALHWAAGCGHLMIVKYLIEKCHCPPDQIQQGKRSFHGRTPLHWSARNGHLEVVKYLIEECDIDIDARTIDGTTAFCWASWQGHLSIMEFLHSKRADVTSVNSFGCNAILWSAQSTQSGLHAIQFLEKIGCDVEMINSNGHGILHKSAQRGKKDVCDWIFLRMRRSMLESGTRSYPREGGGSHKELSNHNKGLDTISLMMIAPDAENCCPSDLAGMEGHYELAKWLVEQEIKVCMESLDVKNKPPWLQEGLLNAKHLANRCGLDDLWEGGSAIKKIAAFIENEQKKKAYLD